MGGPEKVARQHEFNKMTIRERIAHIADPDSFHELGKLAGVGEYDEDGNLTHLTPSNFVFGTADIDDRPVILSGDDFTVRGGSADASIAGKRVQAEGLAAELRLPHIRLVDGMGGGGSVKTIETAGRTYIPELRGWETIVSFEYRSLRVIGAGLRCRHWCSSGRHLPLLGHRQKQCTNDDCRTSAGGLGKFRRRQQRRIGLL